MPEAVSSFKSLGFGRVFVLPSGTRQIEFHFPAATREATR